MSARDEMARAGAARALIDAIPPEAQGGRRWRVVVNGGEVGYVESLVLEAPRFGVLRYGLTPHGFDGWNYHEPSGGGAVVVPFAVLDGGELVVGLVAQERFNQGGTVLNAPRGLVDPGESHADAARREFGEETGQRARAILELPGDPVNPNSAFFETTAPGEGVHLYAMEFDASVLRREGASLAFRDGAPGPPSAGLDERMRERIGACRFVPWHDALAVADMFTVAATGRLLGWLRRVGRWPR